MKHLVRFSLEQWQEILKRSQEALQGDVVSCCPLTETECGMYLEQMNNPDSTEYNVHLLFHIQGAPREAVDAALRATLAAHEAFHSRYGNIDGVPVRIVTEKMPEIHWYRAVNLEEAEAIALSKDVPYDLQAGVPIRLSGYVLESGAMLLHFGVHHIAIDGGSSGTLVEELLARLKGEKPDAAAPDLSDLAFDDHSAQLARGLKHYRAVFRDGVPRSEMPVRGSRLRVMPASDRCKCLEFDAARLAAVEKAARAAGCTTFHFLFSAISIVLSRYCASEDIVLGVPVNTRNERSHNTIGMFVNMAPVRVTPTANKALTDYLCEVAGSIRAATRTDWLPFSRVVQEFACSHDASRHPVFDVSVNYLYMPPVVSSDGISIELSVPLQQMKRDMSITIRRCGGELSFTLQYASLLYDDALIDRFLEHINATLDTMCTRPGTTVGEAGELPAAQAEALEALSATAAADIPEVLLHRMFEKVARSNPDRTALVACDRTMTFSELNAEANRVAYALMALGIGRGDTTVLLLPRRSDYFVAMFGVLKAGAAFIPCDPAYPQERLRHIVDDSEAACVITTKERMSDYPEGFALDISALHAGDGNVNPDVALTGDDLAYIIYTSGSTGAPKGVMLRHRGICNYLYSHPANLHYHILNREVTALLSVTTVSFDMSFKETTGALCNGKTLVFADEAACNDPRALAALFDRTGADAFNATPSRLLQYLEFEPFRKALGRCHLVMSGGEGYPMGLRDRLREILAPDAHIVNTYGPTEITVSCNAAELNKVDHISIGRPLLNVREYIVDAAGRLTPRGVTGELYIGGPGVAKGYRNLPEQTARQFVDFRNGRFYRSGDYARWDADGNVLILGRMDGQVKLRGLRIELGEIESALADQPGVLRAVATIKAVNGQEQLCAYYVSDAPLDESALREALAARLTHYMVPAAFVRLDAIPVTANGKADLKALPVPVLSSTTSDMTSPETEAQREVFDIVADISGSRDFGIHTAFQDIGLTSLTMVSLMLQISERFDRDVTLGELRANDTVEKLAAAMSSAASAETSEVRREYPLTQTQYGIYVECLNNPATTIYNIPVLWKLDDCINLEHLRAAVSAAIDVHPYMKARLQERAGKIYALRDDDAPAQVDIVRLDAPIEPDRLVRPYDLLNDALYRAEIYQTPEGNAFYLDMHHIVSDGRSRALLQRDIEAAYAGKSVKVERFTGFDVALEEAARREGPRHEQAREWYDALLSNVQMTELLRAPEANAQGDSLRLRTALDAETLRVFCRVRRITGNAFFNAVFGYTLGVYSASEDVVFTTIYDGRSDSRVFDTVTMLVKTLPVRCAWTPETRVEDYLLGVRDQLTGSMDSDSFSFAEIADAYGVTADIMVAWQDELSVEPVFCGAPAEVVRPALNTAKSALSIDVSVDDGSIVFEAEHRPEVYGADYVRAFMECMAQIAAEFMARETLGEIHSVSGAMEAALKALHDTDWPVAERPAYRLLQDSAAKWPGRVAAIANGVSLTYAELNTRANRLGRRLRERGFDVDQLCAVLLDRSVDVYVARQGVLKAGGAFLPIDPEYPDDRLSTILEDAGCGLVVTSRALFEARGALLKRPGIEVCFVEEALDSAVPSDDLNIPVPFDALAYSIYTSGSTGKPKGVLLTQRNLVNFVDDNPKNREIMGYIQRGSISLALASIAFDVSIMEEFIPLAHGLTIVMANDDERHDYQALRTLCMNNGVDIMTCTPSLLSHLLDVPDMRPVIEGIKAFDLGAEAFPAALYDRIRAWNRDAYIMNGYGPTETTISCTMAVMEGGERVTIGIPNGNVKVAMLDTRGHVLPIGALGEMVIMGAGVGRGYVNRDDQTAKSFIRLWDRPAYRSGDLARLLPDGNIDFRGRTDNQVKLRGLRVELDEIESVMMAMPGIQLAKVIVRNNGTEDYLAGFYTANKDVSIQAMKDFMRQRLTAYMIPDVLKQLDSMPLTANDKIDKNRLPEVVFKRTAGIFEPPANDVEQAFCEGFAEILRLERVGATDNFFEIGGTSLSAMMLVAFAVDHGWNLVYRNVFDYTTPRALAALVIGQAAQESPLEADEKPEPEGRLAAFDALSRNTASHLDGISSETLGHVLLTGATGFLGIHVLRELLLSGQAETITCLVRPRKRLSPEQRLKTLLAYYFNDPFDAAFDTRIRIVMADITDDDLDRALEGCAVDTIFNCAAVVKHFAQDDIIERVNLLGVRNLIRIALQKNARLIQVSTESVAGQSVNGSVPEDRWFTERDCDIGQTPGTKYTRSKLQAEKDILAAIQDRGLRAKIMRVGNLMSRRSDGEFQINFNTNGFMNRLKAYVALGCFPVEDLDTPAEFSPIDSVARALTLLSGTPDPYTVFHVDNCHVVHMANILEALENCGMRLDVVPAESFRRRLRVMQTDPDHSLEVSSLLSYQTNDDSLYRYVNVSNAYTVKALYRLGFSWPVITPEYIERAIRVMAGFEFFDDGREETL